MDLKQKFYVVAKACTDKVFISEDDNSFESPDALNDVPLPRKAVERLMMDSNLSIFDVFGQIFTQKEDESLPSYRSRVLQEWKKLWKERAVGESGFYKEHSGFERTNERGNGEGFYRWNVRRQRLENKSDQNDFDIDVLSQKSAIDRLKIVWNFIYQMNSELRDYLLPQLGEITVDGYYKLTDDKFLNVIWEYVQNIDFNSKECLLMNNSLSGGENIWLKAVSEIENINASLFRKEFCGCSDDVPSITLNATETLFANEHAGYGNKYSLEDKITIGNIKNDVNKLWRNIERDYKNNSKSKTIWGKIFEQLLKKSKLKIIEIQNSNVLKDDLRECLSGFGINDDILDAMKNPNSSLYDNDQEDNSPRAYLGLWGLEKDGHLEAVVWCQKWESTREGTVLELTSKVPNKVKTDAMKQSLYVRAAGTKSAKYRRHLFVLQMYAIAELGHLDLKGIISRVPVAAEQKPNFAALADQSFILGMQRAIVVNVNENNEIAKENLHKLMTTRNSVPLATISTDVLNYFDFTDSAPWKVSVKKVSLHAFPYARERSETFILYASYKTWKDTPEKLVYSAFFAARVYPTASSLFGMYLIINGLLKSSVNNNLLDSCLYRECAYTLDDGEYTALENLERSAEKVSEHIAWKGSTDELKDAFGESALKID